LAPLASRAVSLALTAHPLARRADRTYLRVVGRRTIFAGGLGAGLVAVVAVGTAVAAVDKGATYSGFITPAASGITITWKVSSSGKKVSGIKLSNVPLFCQSGGEPIAAKFKSASIKKSKFASTAAANFKSGPNKGKPQYRLKLSGRFTSTKSATGTIKVDWFGSDKSCDGKSTFFAQPR
jgi:hypothetical protein